MSKKKPQLPTLSKAKTPVFPGHFMAHRLYEENTTVAKKISKKQQSGKKTK